MQTRNVSEIVVGYALVQLIWQFPVDICRILTRMGFRSHINVITLFSHRNAIRFLIVNILTTKVDQPPPPFHFPSLLQTA